MHTLFLFLDTLDDMWKFNYDTVWGGLFLRATDGDLSFGVDYGFPFYNDHHFHLGYFLYALAYYVKQYPDWGQGMYLEYLSASYKIWQTHP